MEMKVGENVLELNVIGATSEQIKGMDYKEFCRTAVHLMRVQDATDGVENSIAAYIHSRALECVERNGGFPMTPEHQEAVKRDFIGTINKYEVYLTSVEAGKCRVQTLPKPIDAAKRKLLGGMERCADFRTEDTCSKVAKANTAAKKAKKAADEAQLLADYQAAQPDATKGAADVTLTPIELRMAKIAVQMQILADADPGHAEDMLFAMQRKAEEAVAKLKVGVGDRISA